MMSLKTISLYFLLSISSSLTLHAQTLNVEINKVRSNKGNILLSVYNAEKGFPYESTSCIKIFKLKPQIGKVVLTTKDLPKGIYAIALFHDADGNGKLSTNMLGMPKEGYAFSNDASNFLGLPSFKSASFHFQTDTTVYINMKHF